MVRLEVKYNSSWDWLMPDFNSTMVRLEDIADHLPSTGYSNFNSTMVRLEDGLLAHTNKLFFLFQFHYGSIGSHERH